MSAAQAAPAALGAFERFGLLIGLVRRPWMFPLVAAHTLALFIAMIVGVLDAEAIWVAGLPIAALGVLTPVFLSGLSRTLSESAWQDQLTLAGLRPRAVFLVDVGARLVIGAGIALSALPYLLASVVETRELELLFGAVAFLLALLPVAVQGALAAIQARFIGRIAWRLCAVFELWMFARYSDNMLGRLPAVALGAAGTAAVLLAYGIGQLERRPLLLPPRIFAALFCAVQLWLGWGGAVVALAAQLILFERPKWRLSGLPGLLAHPLLAALWALIAALCPWFFGVIEPSWQTTGQFLFFFAVPAVLGLALSFAGLDPVAGASLAASVLSLLVGSWMVEEGPILSAVGGLSLLILVILRLRAGGASEDAAPTRARPSDLLPQDLLPDRWPPMLVKELMALSRGPLFLLAFGLGLVSQFVLIGALLAGETAGAFGSGAPAVALIALAAISTERAGGKLDLLLMMQSPWQLVLGKWAPVALLQLAVFSLSLPALVASYWVMQVDLLSALSAQILTLCGALGLSAVGVWLSTARSWGMGVVMLATTLWAAIFAVPMGMIAVSELLPSSPNLSILSSALLALGLVPMFLLFAALSCRTAT